MSSLIKAYGKVDDQADDQARLLDAAHRNKRNKRIIIITLCFTILVGSVVGAVLGTRVNSGAKSGGGAEDRPLATSTKAICDFTLYPDTCYGSLASLSNSTQIEPIAVFKLAVQVAMTEVSNAAQHLSLPGFLGSSADNMTVMALENCQELLSLAMDHLNSTLLAGSVSLLQVADDLKTWLSSAGTIKFNHLIYI